MLLYDEIMSMHHVPQVNYDIVSLIIRQSQVDYISPNVRIRDINGSKTKIYTIKVRFSSTDKFLKSLDYMEISK